MVRRGNPYFVNISKATTSNVMILKKWQGGFSFEIPGQRTLVENGDCELFLLLMELSCCNVVRKDLLQHAEAEGKPVVNAQLSMTVIFYELENGHGLANKYENAEDSVRSVDYYFCGFIKAIMLHRAFFKSLSHVLLCHQLKKPIVGYEVSAISILILVSQVLNLSPQDFHLRIRSKPPPIVGRSGRAIVSARWVSAAAGLLPRRINSRFSICVVEPAAKIRL